MTASGSIYAGMLGLQQARFDVLYVWNPVSSVYENIMDWVGQAPTPEQIAADEARIAALDAKTQSLDERKADTFVAIGTLDAG